MASDWQRWLRQAGLDLAASQDNMTSGHNEWACFCAQQSAEKALKAALYKQGLTSYITHSVTNLLSRAEQLDADNFAGLQDDAYRLDQVYVPTRYPNGLAGPTVPGEFYRKQDAEQCAQSARSILNACRKFTSK